MLDVLIVAKYVVDFCTRSGTPVSNLQLQKILYYIQLNFYRRFDEPAFIGEFEAWEYGPVVPQVYYQFYTYGAAKICNLYDTARGIFDGERRELANSVIGACVNLSVWELVSRSHKKGGPWDQVYRNNATRIPNDLLIEYAKKS